MRPSPLSLSLALSVLTGPLLADRAEAQPAAAAAAAAKPGAADAASRAGAPPEIDVAGLGKLIAKYKGRPVLVNVFASYCTPCKHEMPAIAKLMKRRPKLVVIGIDVDEKEADAAAFASSVPKGWIVYRSHEGLLPVLPALKLPDDWNEAMPPNWTQSIPLSFIYNPKGDFETGSVGELPQGAYAAIAGIAR